MASKFLRRQKWWVKFRHPQTGEIIRESLNTHDAVRAELLRARLELQVQLPEPRFQKSRCRRTLQSSKDLKYRVRPS